MKTHGLLFSAPMIRSFLRPVNPKTQTRRKITAANSLVDGNGMSAKRWAEMNFDFSRAVVDQGTSPAGNPGPYLKVPARNVPLNGNEETWHRIYPRIDLGDVIYAKETWRITTETMEEARAITEDIMSGTAVAYRATMAADMVRHGCDQLSAREAVEFETWRSAMFMPQWAANIRRKVIAIRPEPLLAISAEDAKAEGLTGRSKDGALVKYGIPDSDGLPGTDDDGWPWRDWRADPCAAYFTLWNQLNGKNAHLQNPRVWVYTLGAE